MDQWSISRIRAISWTIDDHWTMPIGSCLLDRAYWDSVFYFARDWRNSTLLGHFKGFGFLQMFLVQGIAFYNSKKMEMTPARGPQTVFWGNLEILIFRAIGSGAVQFKYLGLSSTQARRWHFEVLIFGAIGSGTGQSMWQYRYLRLGT